MFLMLSGVRHVVGGHVHAQSSCTAGQLQPTNGFSSSSLFRLHRRKKKTHVRRETHIGCIKPEDLGEDHSQDETDDELKELEQESE